MDAFAEPLDEDDLADKLTKLKSGDVDKQINAIQYLGIRLEASAHHPLPPSSPDALILILPPLLSSHSHLLYISVLSNFLPFLLPLLPTDKIGLAVKVLVTGANGLWDKVADAKDRVHKPAEDCLITLGRIVFRPASSIDTTSISSLSASTTGGRSTAIIQSILQAQDNFLTSLLAHLAPSRSARIKSGALRVLRKIKSSSTQAAPESEGGKKENGKALALKGVLPTLVILLEDGDGGVREAARETITSLLSPSSVPLAARTELKKLMLSRSLKSTLIDGVIRGIEIASASSSSSGGGEGVCEGRDGSVLTTGSGKTIAMGGGGSRSLSSSVMKHRQQDGVDAGSMHSDEVHVAKPTVGGGEVKAVHVITEKELERDFEVMSAPFQGKETEDNWKIREKAIHRVRGMLVTDVHKEFRNAFLVCLKAFLNESIKALTSLRSTMSIATSDLYIELARALGTSLDPLLDTILTPLAKMSTLNKKILATKSQEALSALITHTSCAPKVFFPHLQAGVSDKVIQARIYFAGHLKLYLEVHGKSGRSAIEHAPNGGVSILVDSIKKGLTDPNPDVKVIARQAYWVFRSEWQKEGMQLLDQLDDSARKAVEKAGAAGGNASRSVSAANAKLGESTTAARKPSGAIAAALKKARMEAAAKQAAEVEAAEADEMPAGPSMPSTPGDRTSHATQAQMTPTKVPLPGTPSPQRMSKLGTPSPNSDLFRFGLPPHNGQFLDLIDTPARTPAEPPNGAGKRHPSGVPFESPFSKPLAPRQPNVAEQVRGVNQRRTASSSKLDTDSMKPLASIKAMMSRGPPSSLFASLGGRSDCKFWLDRRDEYVHGEPGPVTPEDEAFLQELTTDLDAERLEQLGDLSCEAPNDGQAGSLSDSRNVLTSVRKMQSEKQPGAHHSLWSHVCDTLTDWLVKESSVHQAEVGLFLLWDLAIRHSFALSDKDERIVNACVHLAIKGDFQTRQGSLALLAFLAETTNSLGALSEALWTVGRTGSADGEKSQAERNKAMEVTMVVSSILVLRSVADDVTAIIQSNKDLVMQGMSSPAVAVREATSTFLIACHKILNDQNLLLGISTPVPSSSITPATNDSSALNPPDQALQPLLPDLTNEQRSLLVYQFKAHADVSSGVGSDVQPPHSAGTNGSASLNGGDGSEGSSMK